MKLSRAKFFTVMGGKRRSTLPNGLVAYWKMDELNGNAADATGRGNTLTQGNNPLGVAGKLGNARELVATSTQYLRRATSGADDLSLGDIDWTIAFWFRVANPATVQVVLAKMLSGTTGEFAFYTSGSKLSLTLYDAVSDIGVAQTAALSANTWYLAIGRHRASDNNFNLRLNTTQTDGGATARPIAASNAEFAIGRRSPGPDLYMTGMVDEGGVWKRYLTDAECASLYNGGAGITYPFDDASVRNIVFEGDSMTAGNYMTAANTYPAQVMAQLSDANRYRNVAGSGQTSATMVTDAAGQVDPLYSAIYSPNVAILWAGTNDIGNEGADAATVHARLSAWHAGRRAVGFRTIALTVTRRAYAGPPADPVNINDTVDALNALIRADNAGADVLVDVAANANLLDPADATYFLDGLHLTAVGYGVVAGMVVAAIQGI